MRKSKGVGWECTSPLVYIQGIDELALNYRRQYLLRLNYLQYGETMKNKLKAVFLTGLAIIIPIGITVYILFFLIGIMDRLLDVIPRPFHPDTWIGFHIPGLGVIVTVGVILLCGLLTRSYFGKRVVRYGEGLVEKIPFVGGIYQATKKISDSFFSDREKSFKRVVMIEFPRSGVYTVAFVTGFPITEIAEKTRCHCLNVFVPTTPNPTSGYFLMVPEDEVIDLDLTVEEAFTLIISGGIVAPQEKNTHSLTNRLIDGRN